MRRGFSDLSSTRLFVQEWGEGLPLICLHGLGGGGHFFAPLGAALAAGAHVVAPDLPGCGHSTAASPFSFDACAEAVVALAAQRRWTNACLLGHSMGTIVALEVARRAPAVAGGLVFVGGLPEAPPPAKARLTARVAQVERGGMAGLSQEVVDANFSRPTRGEQPGLTACFGRAFELQPAARYVEATRALARWTARPLPALEGVPCLVVTGEEDGYAPPDAARGFARTLPEGTRVEVLAGCGHLPFLERPAEFADLIRGFLEELRGRS